jgi:Homeodomain-like domain
VWRWQKRYADEGVDRLMRDKTRPPGRKPLPVALKAKVLAKTTRETPPDATHWSVRTMAADPKPFVWTKSAEVILKKERRALDVIDAIKAGNQPTESEH